LVETLIERSDFPVLSSTTEIVSAGIAEVQLARTVLVAK